MKLKKYWALVLCLFLSETISASVMKSENDSVRRIALFAASNDGGEGRQMLRYAESDALSLAKVFEEIGGLLPSDNTILLSPTKQRFRNTLASLKARLDAEGSQSNRTEFIFYYSGHSDGEGLLLRDGKMSYRELRDSLQGIKSDVRIAILDSCQSGVFTRLKGGKRVTPFLMNAANRVSGNVFLSASSESEAAQESDEIGGSFFTHHFVSALRGASDISNDKQVTLNEAYQYAFNQTLENTENSQAGAQHPAYNFQIAGAGDLVLTDIKMASSSLIIPEEIIGRIFVRDVRGGLVVELNKVRYKELIVALEPGRYSVMLEANPELLKSTIDLSTDESLALTYQSFNPVEIVANRNRGETNMSRMYRRKHKKTYSISAGFITSNLSFVGDNFGGYWGQGSNQYPDVVKHYSGYELQFSTGISSRESFDVNYFKAQGWGEYEGLSVNYERAMFKSIISSKEYVSAYWGLGIFAERISNFPVELQNYYSFNIYTLESSEEIGVQFPVGLKAKKGNVEIGAEIRAKFGKESNAIYKENNRFNTIVFSMGYQI